MENTDVLTHHQREALRAAVVLLIDNAFDTLTSIGGLSESTIAWELPHRLQRHYDEALYRDLLVTVIGLGGQLTDTDVPQLRCVGEEFALYIIMPTRGGSRPANRRSTGGSTRTGPSRTLTSSCSTTLPWTASRIRPRISDASTGWPTCIRRGGSSPSEQAWLCTHTSPTGSARERTQSLGRPRGSPAWRLASAARPNSWGRTRTYISHTCTPERWPRNLATSSGSRPSTLSW